MTKAAQQAGSEPWQGLGSPARPGAPGPLLSRAPHLARRLLPSGCPTRATPRSGVGRSSCPGMAVGLGWAFVPVLGRWLGLGVPRGVREADTGGKTSRRILSLE